MLRGKRSRSSTTKSEASRRAQSNPAHDPNAVLDMIAVIDEERRFNQAAALLSPRSAEKVRYEWKARRAAAVLATIRHALAGHGKGSRLPVDRRQFDAYIDTLIETELDTCRDASSGLNAPGARA